MSDIEKIAVSPKSNHEDQVHDTFNGLNYDVFRTITKDIEIKIKQLSAICAPSILTEEGRPTESDFLDWLTSEYRKRKRRADFFRSDIFFGEPAWDMLLDLAIQRCLNKKISVTSACIASSAPMTTALRWIAVLESERLARKSHDPDDRRRQFLEITESGWSGLYLYFVSLRQV